MILEHWTRKEFDEIMRFVNENQTHIKKSIVCGCYNCKSVISSLDIICFEDESVLCPKCKSKTVIGDASGFPIDNLRFLEHINWYKTGFTTLDNGCMTFTRKPACMYCWFEGKDYIGDVYPISKINIKEIEMYTSDFPFQLEGSTDKDEYVYVRHRCNTLTIEIEDKLVYKKNVYDFDHTYRYIVEATKEWFDWPEVCQNDLSIY